MKNTGPGIYLLHVNCNCRLILRVWGSSEDWTQLSNSTLQLDLLVIRCRVIFGDIFQEEKCILWARKYSKCYFCVCTHDSYTNFHIAGLFTASLTMNQTFCYSKPSLYWTSINQILDKSDVSRPLDTHRIIWIVSKITRISLGPDGVTRWLSTNQT